MNMTTITEQAMTDDLAKPFMPWVRKLSQEPLGDFFKVTQLISEELRLDSMYSEFVFSSFLSLELN